MKQKEDNDQILKHLESVTARMSKLEEELNSRKKVLETILDLIDSLIVIIDEDGIIQFVNMQFEKIVGFSTNELVGKVNWSRFVAEEDIERARGYFLNRATGSGDSPSTYSLHVILPGKESRLMQANVAFIPGTDDRIVVLKDLSEVIQAQSKAAESEERYRAAIENTRDGILICSKDRILFTNTSFCNMIGKTREYIYSVNPVTLFHQDDRSKLLSIISAEGKALKKALILEARVCKNQGYFQGELSVAGIKYRNSHAVFISIRELPDRKKIEKELQKKQGFLEALIENSPIGISVHDRNGTLLIANESWRRIWKKTKEDQLKKMIPRSELRMDEKDSYLGDYIRAVEEIYRKGGELYIPQLRLLNPYLEGTEWISHHFYALKDEDGDVDKVITLTVDLTESFKTREELEVTRDKYRELSRNIPVAIYRSTSEPGGRILSANPEMFNMFRIANVEDLGNICVQELYVDADRRRDLIEKIHREKVIENFEAELKRMDGTTFLASISAKGIVGSSGEIEYNEGIIRDITNQRRVEEDQQKVENLESIGTLAGGIAHDFNNLLMSIQGNISLAISGTDEKESRNRLLMAEAATDAAADLARQLLTFSRGGVPVKKKVDLKDIVRTAAQFALRGSSILAEFDINDDLDFVEVDIEQISQVIKNIVLNSVQAMPDGGIIKITCRNMEILEDDNNLKKGSYVLTSIKDFGEGISSENLAKIFNPYFTTKPGGTGLGLSMCYSIISQHSGTIRVSSEQGEGTEIAVYLPIATGVFVEEALTEDLENHEPVDGSMYVLVMDDDPGIRDVLTGMLEILGHRVAECNNGADAISLYKKEMSSGKPFDIVIMDLTIPGGMGGEEAIKYLREIDPEIKAIVSSGYSNNPVISNFSDYGFSGRLAKPFKVSTLKREIHAVLSK
ncbi:MAG: PAS domain S-box protein [Candidatus Aegiribacteria sp.]|nr:PAS domain S-box protein [Candidatus Aegiribacteria sp.]